MPSYHEIGLEQHIGYLVPKAHSENDRPLHHNSHYPLYKRRMDRSGARFEYFTYHKGAKVHMMSKRGDGTNTCEWKRGNGGCNEILEDDLVKLNINDAEYMVNLHSR